MEAKLEKIKKQNNSSKKQGKAYICLIYLKR